MPDVGCFGSSGMPAWSRRLLMEEIAPAVIAAKKPTAENSPDIGMEIESVLLCNPDDK